MKRLEKKMMQKIVRSIIQAWSLTRRRTGKEIKKQCSGVAVGVPVGIPVQVNNVLGCFQKSQEKLSARCAAVAMNVVRMCDSDANRLCSGVVAGSQGNIVGCLTIARNMVSPQCNAALDAASLR
jgi:hypothetical protein